MREVGDRLSGEDDARKVSLLIHEEERRVSSRVRLALTENELHSWGQSI